MFLGIPQTVAQAPSPTISPAPEVIKQDPKALAGEVARDHEINAAHFIAVIDWETGGKWDCTMQSQNYNARDGGRELSFGLAMIHLPDHPEVSKAQAQDCAFSLNWMANEWRHGREWEWTGYKILSGRGWVK